MLLIPPTLGLVHQLKFILEQPFVICALDNRSRLVVVQQMSCANRVESALLCSRLLLCMRILLFYKWFVLLYHFAV